MSLIKTALYIFTFMMIKRVIQSLLVMSQGPSKQAPKQRQKYKQGEVVDADFTVLNEE